MQVNSILKYEDENLLGVLLKKACNKIAVLFGRKDYKFIDRCDWVWSMKTEDAVDDLQDGLLFD